MGPSTEVEGLLKDAIAALKGRKDPGSRTADIEGALACRAYFRLAHFADQTYRHADAQMRSPEWAMRKSVIKHKQEQASCDGHTSPRLDYDRPGKWSLMSAAPTRKDIKSAVVLHVAGTPDATLCDVH